ncbi:hypothetical protein ACFVAQ_31840 [Streptomyces sp. NPDC057651]|uniref:hypothetical protein n=1 Tax=unclassified Streptomyces TaxID=2593676 RepID=UPI00368D3F15
MSDAPPGCSSSPSDTNPIDEAPTDAWHQLSCGHGAMGPRVYDWAAAKLPANIVFHPDPPTYEQWALARCTR